MSAFPSAFAQAGDCILLQQKYDENQREIQLSHYTNIADFLLRNTNQRETNVSASLPADLIGGLSTLSSIGEGKFSGNDVGTGLLC